MKKSISYIMTLESQGELYETGPKANHGVMLALCADGVRGLFPHLRVRDKKVRITLTRLDPTDKVRHFRLPIGSNCVEVNDKFGNMRARRCLLNNTGAWLRENVGFERFSVAFEVLT